MKRNILIGILIVFFLYVFAKILAPGSYINVEEFKFKVKEQSLINAVKTFKSKNPKYNVPSDTQYDLVDGRKSKNDYWYQIHFYFPEDSNIVNAWIRQVDFEPTIIGLVSVRQSSSQLVSKQINKDLSSKENKRQIERFKREIIMPLHQLVGDE